MQTNTKKSNINKVNSNFEPRFSKLYKKHKSLFYRIFLSCFAIYIPIKLLLTQIHHQRNFSIYFKQFTFNVQSAKMILIYHYSKCKILNFSVYSYCSSNFVTSIIVALTQLNICAFQCQHLAYLVHQYHSYKFYQNRIINECARKISSHLRMWKCHSRQK